MKTSNKKKGIEEVDEVFLQEIEAWREALALNIINRNTDITERELNFVIQKPSTGLCSCGFARTGASRTKVASEAPLREKTCMRIC